MSVNGKTKKELMSKDSGGIGFVGTSVSGKEGEFFDLSNAYLPHNKRQLYFMEEYFYKTNGTCRAGARKLAEYPLTDLDYSSIDDTKLREKWKDTLEKTLKTRTVLFETGVNYFVYGDAFVLASTQVKKTYKCKLCNSASSTIADFTNARGTIKRDFNYRRNDQTQISENAFEFKGRCKKCKRDTVIEISEKEVDRKVLFLNIHPRYIDIVYNQYTGTMHYYMSLAENVAKGLREFNPDYFDDTPMLYIVAALAGGGKKIKLNKERLFHFRNVGLTTAVLPELGDSAIMAAFKDLFFSQVLKHSQEIVAKDRTENYRGVCPISENGLSQINYESLKKQIEDEMDKFRSDPNHIGWFPVPVQTLNFGGEAKNLFFGQELERSNDQVLTAMEVHKEFVYGTTGSAYSGMSVMLRMMENRFASYIRDINELFYEFIIPITAKVFGLQVSHGMSIKFKKFKMADDVQQKQLMLNSTDTILSKSYVSEEVFDTKYEEQKKKIEEEAKERAKMDTEIREIITVGDVMAQVRAAVAQANATDPSGAATGDKSKLSIPEVIRTPDILMAAQLVASNLANIPMGPMYVMALQRIQTFAPNVYAEVQRIDPSVIVKAKQIEAAMGQSQQQAGGVQQTPQSSNYEQESGNYGTPEPQSEIKEPNPIQ